MTAASSIVAVDVGNSAIKVAVREPEPAIELPLSIDHAGVDFRSFPLDQPDREEHICRWVDGAASGETVSWWVATVNRAASRPLEVMAIERSRSSGRDVQWRMVGYQDVPIDVQVDAPERVGIDRLLGAYAASVRCGGPLVVVDAGSAVTVDCVENHARDRPVFLGGAIFPGIRLQHNALAAGTEGLHPPPTPAPARPSNARAMTPAGNTEQAIRLGISAAVAGGIDRLYQEYCRVGRSFREGHDAGRPGAEDSQTETASTSPDRPRLIVSGGDCELISELLLSHHETVRGLVCEGLLDLAVLQCPNPALRAKL